MGRKSVLGDLLATGRPAEPSTRALAFDDAGGSSVLRSAADRLGRPVKKMGRPRGAKSRDAAKLLALIQARAGTDPLLWMADWLTLTVQEAARVLGCEVLEAAEYQRKCAVEVNRYGRGLPVQRVEVTGQEGEALPLFQVNMWASEPQAAAHVGFGLDTDFTGEIIDAVAEVTEGGITDAGDDDASA